MINWLIEHWAEISVYVNLSCLGLAFIGIIIWLIIYIHDSNRIKDGTNK